MLSSGKMAGLLHPKEGVYVLKLGKGGLWPADFLKNEHAQCHLTNSPSMNGQHNMLG